MRTLILLAAVAMLPLMVVGTESAAHAARGITTPTTPTNHNVGPVFTYYASYSQDYGDPRCPSNVDESKNKCVTYFFAIELYDQNSHQWAVTNPQSGCGPQDHCTYGTDIPCPSDAGQGPQMYRAEFRQQVIPADGSAPWFDTRLSGTVLLNPCVYRISP
jgi:hypothetical protein